MNSSEKTIVPTTPMQSCEPISAKSIMLLLRSRSFRRPYMNAMATVHVIRVNMEMVSIKYVYHAPVSMAMNGVVLNSIMGKEVLLLMMLNCIVCQNVIAAVFSDTSHILCSFRDYLMMFSK